MYNILVTQITVYIYMCVCVCARARASSAPLVLMHVTAARNDKGNGAKYLIPRTATQLLGV